ncbi:MAG: ribbon-helix-helix protein, CopG family [Archaeoglobaceae archaeon]|nr:ribbon-helix-helix protein, CopG family [Archaeoglobaceae archaeon]MCX8152186.1 ribbon-helix-helix protein, CopG family [Archaeoglobaceae archaeon]MDW8013902.1 ribbon-helix-helix protein, CopG family [Archaeoglobaceae archaeon]
MVERISLSLDKVTKDKLDKLVKDTGKSASQVVRELIDLGYEILTSKIDTESIKVWADYLAKGQHIILDIEHWRVIFSEIEKVNNEGFWKQMEEIGLSHAVQYKLKGLDTVEKILRYVEKTNWYEIKVENEGIYTLILNDLKIKKFVKIFLEKVFEGQKLKVDIKEGFGKLIVISL